MRKIMRKSEREKEKEREREREREKERESERQYYQFRQGNLKQSIDPVQPLHNLLPV